MARTTYVEVSPAYGKDYRNATDARNAWKNGTDFVESTSSRYCSIRDFPGDGYRVIIRYGKGLKVTGA